MAKRATSEGSSDGSMGSKMLAVLDADAAKADEGGGELAGPIATLKRDFSKALESLRAVLGDVHGLWDQLNSKTKGKAKSQFRQEVERLALTAAGHAAGRLAERLMSGEGSRNVRKAVQNMAGGDDDESGSNGSGGGRGRGGASSGRGGKGRGSSSGRGGSRGRSSRGGGSRSNGSSSGSSSSKRSSGGGASAGSSGRKKSSKKASSRK